MAVITRSVMTRKRPRNPGPVDFVLRASAFDEYIKSLLHFNGANGATTFLDEIGKTWTPAGNAQILVSQSRFGGASGHASNSASNTNYISTPNHVDFQLGNSDFTIDFWTRFISVTDTVYLFNKRGGAGNESYTFTYQTSTNTLRFNYTSDGTTFLGPATFSWTPAMNIWYHIALVRSGSDLKCFVNGVQLGSTYNIGSTSIFAGTAPFKMWGEINSGTHSAYLDEFRVSKGIARWTANFVPQGYEYGGINLVDDAFTGALLHFNGPDADNNFFDVAGPVWVAINQAQIDTAQSKFGGSSGLFDGTSDYIYTFDYPVFTFGAGDFTIDFWVRFNSVATAQIIYDGRANNTDVSYKPTIYTTPTKIGFLTNGANRITGTTNLATGQWYHVALVRSGTSTKLFLNGNQEGSTYTDSNNYINGANRPIIGADGSAGNGLNGWLDELRVSKGIARWTANFTPPTSEYAP